jgi:hypothetical protein
MAVHFHQSSMFQFSQSHHPIELPILMKCLDLLHEGEMELQKEIPRIDPSYGSPLQDVESRHQTHDIILHGRIYPDDQAVAQ